MRHLLLVAASLVSLTGCLRKTEFKCQTSDQCSTGGICEMTTGYCSFADSDCADGRRYGGLSGDLAGQCVGGGSGSGSDVVDAGIDGMVIDAPPGNVCPASYATLPGAGTHVYRLLTASAAWATQKGLCSADGSGAYLAVPNNQAELTAIMTAINQAHGWVGIDDMATEGTYVTANGGTFSATDPLWDTGQPDNKPFAGAGGSDCVSGVKATNRLADTKCSESYTAICECDP